MTDKPAAPRGRPITNKMEPIPATAQEIAKAMFKAADKKIDKQPKPRKKPN